MEFFPAGARVPEAKRTSRVWLRALVPADAERDYDAVMSSVEQLRCWGATGWPADDFPLAENRADLERHEREHITREAFTFTVLSPDGARCLGCVYLAPPSPAERVLCSDARCAVTVGFWVRSSELASGLETHLLATLREWLAADWPFDAVLFTLSRANTRQAATLLDAGLTSCLESHRPAGRACITFR